MAEAAVAEPVKTEEPLKTVLTTTPEVKAEAKPEAKPEVKVEPDYSKITLPENSKLTTKELEASIAQAKKEGRTPDVVQLILNERDAAMKGYEVSEVQRLKGESEKWLADLKADKEIGGDNFNKSVENAKRVVDKYTDKEFREFLDKSGLGNHPMLVRTFAKIGKAFGEDHWVDGTAITPKKDVSPASIMYDKTDK